MDGWHFSAIGVRFLLGGEGPAHGVLCLTQPGKPDPGVCQVVPHSLNSAYSDGSSQILWEDSERVFHRGWRLDDDGKRHAMLLVAPAADHPSRSTLDHFSHEYELKDELDGTWAVRPLELVREANRTMLVLEDAGGEPLEMLLGVPIDMGRFLHLGRRCARRTVCQSPLCPR